MLQVGEVCDMTVGPDHDDPSGVSEAAPQRQRDPGGGRREIRHVGAIREELAESRAGLRQLPGIRRPGHSATVRSS